MAKLIQAVTEFRPKLEQAAPVKVHELADYIARCTGQQRSQTTAALIELEEAILFFHAVGRNVQIPGLGSFGASIGLDGARRILFRPGRSIVKRLNALEFRGNIDNMANKGKTMEELKGLWDAAHPDDPLELPSFIRTSGTNSAGTNGAGSDSPGAVAAPQD